MSKILQLLRDKSKGVLKIGDEGSIEVLDHSRLQSDWLDGLVWEATLGEEREAYRWLLRRLGLEVGVIPASIHDLYLAMGRGEVDAMTVPAINIRGLTYEMSRSIIRAAKKLEAGAILFEIARSEIGYTFQRPAEYTAAVVAGAIREGWVGPLFLQGDHFQVKLSAYKKDPAQELQAVKDLTLEALQAGFYNIDIDTSTLVDLEQKGLDAQQKLNYEHCAELTALIRQHQPDGVMVSVGGEIGEVGSKNSTVEEFEAFMEGYLRTLKEHGSGLTGISKISVQTGTSHGGVPRPDGSVAEVKLDFGVLEAIARVAREKYGLGGTVQHGASTLPDDLFHRFPPTQTCEVHLATGFQNILYDLFPHDLRDKIYNWLTEELSGERKEGQTNEQFYYKTRKKGFGPFKQDLWDLPAEWRQRAGETLEEKFVFLFEQLGIQNSRSLIEKQIKPVSVLPSLPWAND